MRQIDQWSKGHWLTLIVLLASQPSIKVGTLFVELMCAETCFAKVTTEWQLYSWLIFPHHFPLVPQASTKPSPSKRRCSEENLAAAAAGEENQEPMTTQPVTPMLSDPPTDKKPPVGPTSIRSSSSLERTASRPAVQSQQGQLKSAQPEPEKMAVTTSPDPPGWGEAEMLSDNSALQRKKESVDEDPTPPAGMKSRLQRLAEQRKCWDGSSKNVFWFF